MDPEATHGAKGAAAAAVSAFRPVTSFPYTFQTSDQIGLVCIHVPKGPCGSVTPTYGYHLDPLLPFQVAGF